ncbi:Crp/Fnr family transcriptional regulator [Reichenbachiella versicolor]|uniref:Crp/Fnr family transcriptional regulator n=1 Tax=Reichenbachiella versicolor TaxID=1821036 RepID=UPI000D6E5C81|nr:cyclic nucleotide-binding domain-containing protein [Reichenbachiella versicolor]
MNNLTKLFKSILPLSGADELLLEEHLKPECFSKKESYNELGRVCTKLGFVEEGIFKVSSFKVDGSEYIKYFVDSGHFLIDLDSFFHKSPSTESIVALMDSKVLTINSRSYRILEDNIENFPKIIYHLKEKALIAKFSLKNEMLVDDAVTRYHKFVKRHPAINQKVSQRHIAMHLGISEYTLSRIRAQK